MTLPSRLKVTGMITLTSYAHDAAFVDGTYDITIAGGPRIVAAFHATRCTQDANC